jgi:thiol-disulfide isomerase/thioredoxin
MTTTHLTIDLEPALAAPKALLYFTAAWCAPCKMFGPILAKFAENNTDITVVKIDADEKRDLLNLYGVRGVPTVIALEFGAEKSRQTGLTDDSYLASMFE